MINWVTIENLKEIVSRIKSLITSHTSNKNNPHCVTPAQIGASTSADFQTVLSELETLKYGVNLNGGNAFTAEVDYDIDYDGGGAFDQ